MSLYGLIFANFKAYGEGLELASIYNSPSPDKSTQELQINYLVTAISTESPWCWENLISELFVHAITGDSEKVHEIIKDSKLLEYQKQSCLLHLKSILNRFQ